MHVIVMVDLLCMRSIEFACVRRASSAGWTVLTSCVAEAEEVDYCLDDFLLTNFVEMGRTSTAPRHENLKVGVCGKPQLAHWQSGKRSRLLHPLDKGRWTLLL
jgi:hypothetical protein